MIINKSGTTIRLHADVIKETKSRVAQGTKVIELKKRNDSIGHLCIVPRAEEEEESNSEENAENTTEQINENDNK